MYLSFDDWSPRYDAKCFYTVQLTGYVLVTSLEQLDMLQQCQSLPNSNTNEKETVGTADNRSDITIKKDTFPTYYYICIVYRGHQTTILYRQYLQFEWLYQQLLKTKHKSKLVATTTKIPIDIPHPLQGSNNDKCNFLGGTHCFIVARYIQEVYDYVWQQQLQYDSTSANKREWTSKFAETRCQLLSYFLTTILESPMYANDVATRQFLNL